MTEKKKKEHTKKPEEILNASVELANMSTIVAETIKEQEQISQSISNAIKALDYSPFSGILASLDCLKGTLSSIKQLSTIMGEKPAIFSVIESSASALSNLGTVSSQIRQMHENIESMSKLIDPSEVKLPEIIIPRIKEIDSQKDTIIKSLASQIEYLESELSKEKEKNNELLALLDEKRKELKKQYVT